MGSNTDKLTIAVGCDHAAVSFKKEMLEYMQSEGYNVVDCGGDPCRCEGTDYPDIADIVCEKVQQNECDCGVLICGTGVGMSMAANKHRGIRAALCDNCYNAKYTRLHNDANVLCLGSRTTGPELAKMILDYFLKTPFEGGRHQRRVDKIMALDGRS